MTPSLLQIAFFCFVIIAGSAVAYFRLPAILRSKTPGPWCLNCGYSLHAHELPDVRCPECGCRPQPSGIIMSRDPWLAYTGRQLARCALAFIMIAVASPLCSPREQQRWTTLDFQSPHSRAYARVRILLTDNRWVLPFGIPIPFASQESDASWDLWLPGGFTSLEMVCGTDTHNIYLPEKGYLFIRSPLTQERLLMLVSRRGVYPDSAEVQAEFDAIWTSYQAAMTHVARRPPEGLFRDVDLQFDGWGRRAQRSPSPRIFAYLGLWLLFSLWLYIALRIRRRAMFEASLAGPHGLATGRYGSLPVEHPQQPGNK